MKTRLISTTMAILFAALTLAGTANNRTDNSSATSRIENITEQNISDLNSCCPSAEPTTMEEWIDSRDVWEQIGHEEIASNSAMGSEMLEDWMVSRDTWEQQDMHVENPSGIPSVLEQWTARSDNWEQK